MWVDAASTNTHNTASHRVLAKNGFEQYGFARNHLHIIGPWDDANLDLNDRAQANSPTDRLSLVSLVPARTFLGLRRVGFTARAVASSRQAANELVAGMEQVGLVERRPHPQDRRTQEVHLTATGRKRLLAARPAVH